MNEAPVKKSAKTKGHWPKGKPRNHPGIPDDDLNALLLKIRIICRHPDRTGRGPSYTHLGRTLGVDQRTIRRWCLDGRKPDRVHIAGLRAYVKRFRHNLPPKK